MMGVVLPLFLYFLFAKLIIKKWLKEGFVKSMGLSEAGVPVYVVEDSLANASAVSIGRHSYIIVTSGLLRILDADELNSIIEHEENHIRLMHNLVIILVQTLLLLTATLIVSFLIGNPVIMLVNYAATLLMGIVLLRGLQRGLERIADRVSSPSKLHSSLRKMARNNRDVLGYRITGHHLLRWLFSTHPPEELRPEVFNPTKQASILGAFISFLVAISLSTRLIEISSLKPSIFVFIFSFILSVCVLGSGLVVVSYFFLNYLTKLLCNVFNARLIESTNILNGMTVFLVLTSIPVIHGINQPFILLCFTIFSLIAATLFTGLGGTPLKKALIASAIAWIVNSILYISAFMIYFKLNLLPSQEWLSLTEYFYSLK